MNEVTKPKKRIHVEIDKDIHIAMRVQAMKEGKAIGEFLENLITSYISTVEAK